MTETDGWLARYENTHRDITYPALYWAAVPIVVQRQQQGRPYGKQ